MCVCVREGSASLTFVGEGGSPNGGSCAACLLQDFSLSQSDLENTRCRLHSFVARKSPQEWSKISQNIAGSCEGLLA